MERFREHEKMFKTKAFSQKALLANNKNGDQDDSDNSDNLDD